MIKKIEIGSHDREKLANISIDPATQANDFFDYSKVVVKKPWGYEYLMFQNELVAVWILYIKSGFQTSKHCHPSKKTSLIVLSGEVCCSLLKGTIKRSAGDGLFLGKGVFHSTEAVSPNGAIVIETETPNNKRDLVRLEDKYGRVGKGYETVKEMSYNLQNYNYITFIDPKIYYNATKRFGACSLTISEFKNYMDFKEEFRAKGWNAVTILRGKFLDEKKNIVIEPGDTLDLDSVRLLNRQKIKTDDKIEVIAIKKKDSLVKLSDYVFSFLEKENVKDIFFVPGSSTVHLLDSLGRNTNLRHIRTQTEQSAAMTAEAYSKLTNDLGVALIPSGSSGTNALTGVADAWVDSTPLLVLSGQARSDETIQKSSLRQLGIQELNIVDIVKPVTKYAVMIQDANTIKYHLEKASYLARSGRPGPVWIDIPINIQGMVIDEEELASFNPSELKEPSPVTRLVQPIDKTIRYLQNAKRPVLLVGNGVRLSGAEKELLKLIDLLSIPVLTSRRGADLISGGHPLFFGRPGAYGSRNANFVIQNSDLLISIGSRLSLPQIGRNYKAFARAATRIVVDIDSAELKKKTINPDLAVWCSAKHFIREMTLKLSGMKKPPVDKKAVEDWIKKCRAWKLKYSEKFENGYESMKFINVYNFMKVLAQELKEGDIVTVDGGAPMIFFMQAFSFKPRQRFISATGLENLSFALPAAVGACVGNTGKEVVCICEDDGFQKNIQELKTIVKYNLPIKLFVLNTGGCPYLIRDTQREYFGGRFVAADSNEETIATNILKIGESYKISTFKIEHQAELADKISQVLKFQGACICEVNIDKNQKVIPKQVFTVKPDGKWISKPLEDMYPFLDRKEFRENMVIELWEEE